MDHFARPRRILHTGQQAPHSTSSDLLRGSQSPGLEAGVRPVAAGTGTPKPRLAERYARRPAELRDTIGRLDAGLDEKTRQQLAEWIGEQYLTSFGEMPVGFFAVCHLGPPYVDHELNLAMAIVRHFTPQDSLPEPFGQARMLVRSGSYAYVEVYSGGLVLPVFENGTVVRP